MAVIGPGTARALADHGIRADVVPERFVAESLVQALEALPVKRALIVRASEARDVLPDALRARGAEVEVLPVYETVAEPLAEQALAGRPRGRLHHLHLLLDGALLPGGRGRRGRPRSPRHGSSRSDPSPPPRWQRRA